MSKLSSYVREYHTGAGSITTGLITPFYSKSDGDFHLVQPAQGAENHTRAVGTITITDYSAITASTAVILSAYTPATAPLVVTSYAFHEGTHWDAATSNNATALSLKAAIAANANFTGVEVYPPGSGVIYVYQNAGGELGNQPIADPGAGITVLGFHEGVEAAWHNPRNHVSRAINLGFSFPFADESYDSVAASINGWLLLSGNVSQSTTNPMYASAQNAYGGDNTNVVLFPWWTPQKPAHYNESRSANSYGATSVDGGLFFRRESNRVIITWITYGHPEHVDTDHNLLEYQVVLYSSGQIEFRHEAVDTVGSPVAGVASTTAAAKGVRVATTSSAVAGSWTGLAAENEIHDFLSTDGYPYNDGSPSVPKVTATEGVDWVTGTFYFAKTPSAKALSIIVPEDMFKLSSETEEVYKVTYSGGVYAFDAINNVTISTKRGGRYVFSQEDSTNSAQPLAFSVGKDGSHKGHSRYEGVSYYINGSTVTYADYVSAFNDASSGTVPTKPEVHLRVSETSSIRGSTPTVLLPYSTETSGAGGTTRFSIDEAASTALVPIVRPIRVIIVADENFSGESPIENRYAYQEWFNRVTNVPYQGLNFFNVYYSHGTIVLRVLHGAKNWHWSTTAFSPDSTTLSGNKVTLGNSAVNVISSGGTYDFYAWAVDDNDKPVGSQLARQITISQEEFLADDDAGVAPASPAATDPTCPPNISEALVIQAPTLSDAPVARTGNYVNILSINVGQRPHSSTDGLTNPYSSNVFVHMIVGLTGTWDFWTYSVDGGDVKVVADKDASGNLVNQATFALDIDKTKSGEHSVQVVGYVHGGAYTSTHTKTFNFEPPKMSKTYVGIDIDRERLESSFGFDFNSKRSKDAPQPALYKPTGWLAYTRSKRNAK